MTSQKEPPILTANEALAITRASIGGSGSDGIPAAFKSREMLYRIRWTILHYMGSAHLDSTVDANKSQFLADFQPQVTLPVLTMLIAQWDELADLRIAACQDLKTILSHRSSIRVMEAATLMREFVRPLRQREEIVDWHLFHGCIAGSIDNASSRWLKRVWDHFEIDFPNTFLRRFKIGFTLRRAKLEAIE